MSVIRFNARSNAANLNRMANDGAHSVRLSIMELNATIKHMHSLWQLSPNAAGIELIIRWQELRDRLELLDLRAPDAQEQLETVRSQLTSMSEDLFNWCTTFSRGVSTS